MNVKQLFFALLVGMLPAAAFAESEVTEEALSGASVDFSHGSLKVSENHRFLQHEDGTPFFYLADTAWELFHRLNREEADKYLENRRQKGFTVIQAVVLAELNGLNDPNPYGHTPLIDNDPTKPNEDYFKHVDYIVDQAAQKGLYISMLPTWGDKINKRWGVGPVIFNATNAEAYGRYLGKRYKDRPNIIWVLGGDRAPEGTEAIWRAMVAGIRSEDDSHLMTYHPQGRRSSSEWFHNDDWLDFNMLHSGQKRYNYPNYEKIQRDYNKTPAKPCMDAEPNYENLPVGLDPENGWFDDYDVRKACYWALFAGGHGHTYGCHDIWQMMAPGRQPIFSARNYWYEVMDLPGAWDMMHAKHLLLSRPFFSRVPDQSLIADGQGEGTHHVQAARGEGYALVYIPSGRTIKVNMGKISGGQVQAWWFNPRTGEVSEIGRNNSQGAAVFDPPGKPGEGNDWVLVLDDAQRHFPKPGQTR